MESKLKVTEEQLEAAFSDFVAGDYVISIPLFQRQYRWVKKNLDDLMADVNAILNEEAGSYFLGIIVCVSRAAVPGRPAILEIVDGQQRLSTLYLLLLACAETLASKGHVDKAMALVQTYLLVRPLPANPENTKLMPSMRDRRQFKEIWDRFCIIKGVAQDPTFMSNPPSPPAAVGHEKGKMADQYGRMRSIAQAAYKADSEEGVNRLANALATCLSFVSIVLRDPAVAPKIFERLNSRAERVTTGELVRNEVFARTSVADIATTKHVFQTDWEPFQAKFDRVPDGFEKFLFPYGLIQNPAIKKEQLFSELRREWKNLPGPKEIIQHMAAYAPVFLSLEAGERPSGVPEPVVKRLLRLNRAGKPSSVFAFVMKIVEGLREAEVSEPQVIEILDVVESFLVRRAVCGIEPTGLHAVFKGMWGALEDESGNRDASARRVAAVIEGRTTVEWPSDATFEKAIREGNLYDRNICNYVLWEYELAAKGDSPQNQTVTVEHILPQSLSDEWRASFSDEEHRRLHQTWANLVPLSEPMNPSVGQQPYDQKRRIYQQSMFATPKEVAARFERWTPVELKERATALVGWATKRWPR
jgi:hypothetical protein